MRHRPINTQLDVEKSDGNILKTCWTTFSISNSRISSGLDKWQHLYWVDIRAVTATSEGWFRVAEDISGFISVWCVSKQQPWCCHVSRQLVYHTYSFPQILSTSYFFSSVVFLHTSGMLQCWFGEQQLPLWCAAMDTTAKAWLTNQDLTRFREFFKTFFFLLFLILAQNQHMQISDSVKWTTTVNWCTS